MDTVYRTILNGVIDLKYRIVCQINHLDITGIIYAEYVRACFHAYTAYNAIAEFNNRYFHFIR